MSCVFHMSCIIINIIIIIIIIIFIIIIFVINLGGWGRKASSVTSTKRLTYALDDSHHPCL